VLLAIVSGLVSAGLAASGEIGSLPRMLLLAVVPLPLFATGLSAGALSCLAAGLAGAVAVTVGLGSIAGAVYLGAAAAPTAILVRRALRPVRQGDAAPAWRTGGGILLWLTALGLLGVVALIGYLKVFENGLPAMIAERFELEPGSAAMVARIAPGFAAALWMGLMALNGGAAEWVLARLDRAIRPPPDIRKLGLPLWVGPILMVTGLAGAVLRHGTVGMICLNSAIVLIVPFAFLGLAVIHAVAGTRPGGSALVLAVYVVLLATPALFGWRAMLLLALGLAGLGSADQLMDFRDLRGLRSGMRRK
jgi:hypothetical protein